MKNRFLLILAIVLCCSMTMFGQNQKISYQAVVRDSTNHLVVSTPLTVEIKLTDSLLHFYSENHSVTTNPNGMMSLWIGAGSSPSGNWNDLVWNKVTVESKIYRQSDGKLIVIHNMPMSAVPYALYAEKVNADTLATYVEMHQLQADWNESDTLSKAYIKHKPAIPIVPTVNDGHLDIVLANDTITFTANQAGNTMVNIDSVIQKLEEMIATLEEKITALETGTFICGASRLKDRQGNFYETVVINSQCWTKSNMRATVLPDSTVITKSDTNFSLTEAYYYVVKDTVGPSLDSSIYGYLYNWKAAKQVCPTGWHLPTVAEWNTFTTYLSGRTDYRCSSNIEYLAKVIASTSKWKASSTPCDVGYYIQKNNNATGFTAYPAGEKNVKNGISSLYEEAVFWLDKADGSGNGACSYLNYNDPKLYKLTSPNQQHGFSVRCVQN